MGSRATARPSHVVAPPRVIRSPAGAGKLIPPPGRSASAAAGLGTHLGRPRLYGGPLVGAPGGVRRRAPDRPLPRRAPRGEARDAGDRRAGGPGGHRGGAALPPR